MKKRLLLLIGFIFLLTGCFDNPEVEPTSESLKDNIEVKKEKYFDKELLFLKNNNKKNVSINIEIDYLNDEDTIIYNEAKNILSVGEKNEIVLKVNNVPSEYKESRISYDVTISTYIKDYTKNIEIEHKRGNKVIASVKNTSDVTINNLSLAVVFYNNKKIVGYDEEIILDLKSNEKGTLEFFNPMDKDHNYVKYDDYKIYTNYAYSFDYENKS
ncbi:MAG: hypothetical protein IJH20_03830 [Bacilli bacterium]|nr:hypothetical protein [Bacilli bacterium]